MTATTLNAVRDQLVAALDGIPDVEVYRHIAVDYQYPAILVGHPESVDVRPAFGDQRDFVIVVNIAIEVVDPESSYDLLYELLDTVAEVLLSEPTWDVRPATNFGEELLADNRVVSRCRLPVAVFT